MEACTAHEGKGAKTMVEQTYFNSIYNDTYQEILKFVIIKTSNADQVDDILQNTYKNFYARILKKGFGDISEPKAFLFRMAQRELSRHYRRKALKGEMETGLEQYDGQMETDELSFADIVEMKDMLDTVRDTVAHLPLLSYKCFILFYYYDMPIAPIAQQLNISENNVKNRLWRARVAVRKDIKGNRNE